MLAIKTAKPECSSNQVDAKSTKMTANFAFIVNYIFHEYFNEFLTFSDAQKWKAKFVEAQQIMKEAIPKHNATIESSKSSLNI